MFQSFIAKIRLIQSILTNYSIIKPFPQDLSISEKERSNFLFLRLFAISKRLNFEKLHGDSSLVFEFRAVKWLDRTRYTSALE